MLQRLSIYLCAIGLCSGSAFAVQYAGNVVSTSLGTNRIDFTLQQGAVARVEMPNEGLVRVRVNPTGTFTDQLTGAISATNLIPPGAAAYDSPTAAFLISQTTIVAILKSPFQVVILRSDGSLVTADQPGGILWDPQSGVIQGEKIAMPGEHYFGMGERGGPLDRRGRAFVMRNVDWAGYGEFTDPLYISIPFYYGMNNGKAYGFFLDNAAYPSVDFDSGLPGTVLFGAQQGELDYYVMTGPDPASVANLYARLTGFTPLPPLWTLGFHQSRYGYTSQQQLFQVATTLRSLNIPCDSIYLDIDYMNQLQQLSWNPVNFPDPQQMNQLLEQGGFKRVNIFEPLVRTDDPLWLYMADSGYFLKDSTSSPVVASIWYGNVSFTDYTKDSARAWYKEALKTFLAQGVTATWNDLNEPAAVYLPAAIFDYNGQERNETQSRDLFALNVNSLTHEAQLELRPNTRPWALSRSGFSGIQRYAANWSGDANSTFDSLRVSIQITNHMGLSGQNQFGHDIGGFLGSPDAELFIRWLEFGSYIPLFRSHATNTSLPREPYVFGEPYTTMARNIINQRYRMLPYIYTLHESASTEGTPVVAPLLFYFPADQNTYTQDQEFMLGPWLLVAPVSQEGAISRTVYLPEGTNWTDLYTDTTYSGGQQITAAAPLERIPVFVREGAIIPEGPVMQYVTQQVPATPTLDFYPGADSEFTLYEDDGTSFDFQNGAFLRTTISRTQQSNGTVVNIARTQGTWLPPARPWTLNFHNSTMPSAITVNGFPISYLPDVASLSGTAWGWTYDSTTHEIVVKTQDSAQPISVSMQQ